MHIKWSSSISSCSPTDLRYRRRSTVVNNVEKQLLRQNIVDTESTCVFPTAHRSDDETRSYSRCCCYLVRFHWAFVSQQTTDTMQRVVELKTTDRANTVPSRPGKDGLGKHSGENSYLRSVHFSAIWMSAYPTVERLTYPQNLRYWELGERVPMVHIVFAPVCSIRPIQQNIKGKWRLKHAPITAKAHFCETCLTPDELQNRRPVKHKSVLSFLRQQITWHCSHLLLNAILLRHLAAITVDRYLLSAGPTAANPPQWHAVVDRWERQTPYRYIDPAAYYATVSITVCVQRIHRDSEFMLQHLVTLFETETTDIRHKYHTG